MTRILALLLSLTVARQAQAMSCIETDVLTDFANRHASSNSYVVLRGQVSFDAQHLAALVATQGPRVADPLTGEAVPVPVVPPVPGRFEGWSLGPRGFTQPLTTDIALNASCMMDCRDFEPGRDQLIFAQSTEAGYEITISDCGNGLYPSPDRATVRAMTACLRGEGCPPASP